MAHFLKINLDIYSRILTIMKRTVNFSKRKYREEKKISNEKSLRNVNLPGLSLHKINKILDYKSFLFQNI